MAIELRFNCTSVSGDSFRHRKWIDVDIASFQSVTAHDIPSDRYRRYTRCRAQVVILDWQKFTLIKMRRVAIECKRSGHMSYGIDLKLIRRCGMCFIFGSSIRASSECAVDKSFGRITLWIYHPKIGFNSIFNSSAFGCGMAHFEWPIGFHGTNNSNTNCTILHSNSVQRKLLDRQENNWPFISLFDPTSKLIFVLLGIPHPIGSDTPKIHSIILVENFNCHPFSSFDSFQSSLFGIRCLARSARTLNSLAEPKTIDR